MVAIMSPNRAAKTAKRAATSATKSVPKSSPVQIATANGRQGVQAWLDQVTPEQQRLVRRLDHLIQEVTPQSRSQGWEQARWPASLPTRRGLGAAPTPRLPSSASELRCSIDEFRGGLRRSGPYRPDGPETGLDCQPKGSGGVGRPHPSCPQ